MDDKIHADSEPTGQYELKVHGGHDVPENNHRDLYDPDGRWLCQLDIGTPISMDSSLGEIIVQLYNLDRSELRRVAYEALMISDGPDRIDGDVEDPTINVAVEQQSRQGLLKAERGGVLFNVSEV